MKGEQAVCGSADEAIKTMLIERKLSSKINYDVLRGLKCEIKVLFIYIFIDLLSEKLH